MPNPWVRLGTALIAGPPIGLSAFFAVVSFLDNPNAVADPQLTPINLARIPALLFGAYLVGLLPAFVGGVAAFWIAAKVTNRIVRVAASVLAGALAPIVSFDALILLTGHLTAPEYLPLWPGWTFFLVGGIAALGSTAIAAAIEFINSDGVPADRAS